ncbi:hypothetical protein GCM10022393_41820 [Aquimarina addita]|uniref:Transporter n=1 Tax=Aquimarina addita TaxID=870485 RepID=A0ABP6UW42_9FLAO
MRKLVLYIIFTVITIPTTLGCDVCGCQLSGLSFGMLAGTSTHYIGVRFTQASFNASIRYNSDLLQDEYSQDTFTRTEILGRYIFSNKFQIHSIIPYISNTMNGSVQDLEFNGFGDPSLLLFYDVLAKKQSDDKIAAPPTTIISHSLLIGGGVKLPMGTFDRFDRGEVVNRNFQIGSGSVDFLLSSNYTIALHRWGLNIEASYKMNTRNSDNYRFGNQFNSSGYLFYTIPIKNGIISPFAGTLYETAGTHDDDGIQQFNTGGNATLGTLGLQCNWKSFSLNALIQHPLQQNYNSDDISFIETEERFSIGLIFHFAKKEKKKFGFP